MVLGHEFVGEVVEAAPGGGRFAVGDARRPAAPACRAASATAVARAGRTSAVATTRSGSTPPAAWPSTSPCPRRRLVPVPDGLSVDSAGLAQPLAVGLHAARRSGVTRRVTASSSSAPAPSARSCWPASATWPTSTSPSSTSPAPGWTGPPGWARPGRSPPAPDDRAEALARGAGAAGADVVIEASGAPGQLDNAIAPRPHRRDRSSRWACPPGQQEVDVHTLVMREITVRDHPRPRLRPRTSRPALDILATTRLADELLDSVRPLEDLRRAARATGHRAARGQGAVRPAPPADAATDDRHPPSS